MDRAVLITVGKRDVVEAAAARILKPLRIVDSESGVDRCLDVLGADVAVAAPAGFSCCRARSVRGSNDIAGRQGLVPGAVPGRLVLPSAEEGAPPVLVLEFDAQAALAEDPQAAGLREVILSLDVPQTPAAVEPFPTWHKEEYWYWSDELDVTFEPIKLMDYYTKLFSKPQVLIDKYSDAQLEQGLLAMRSCLLPGAISEVLWEEEIPSDVREECIRSMYFLYRDLFSVKPLHTACFMHRPNRGG